MARYRAAFHVFGIIAALVTSCSLLVDDGGLDDGCPVGQKACQGRCVSEDDPDFGCASGSCSPCPAGEGGAASETRVIACVHGECASLCAFGFGCDACDKNLLTDEQNCGDCGIACSPGESCVCGVCMTCTEGDCFDAHSLCGRATSTRPEVETRSP